MTIPTRRPVINSESETPGSVWEPNLSTDSGEPSAGPVSSPLATTPSAGDGITKLKALVADDDGPTRHILMTMLRRLGYEAIGCADGTAAWEVMQSPGAPLLALLDWMMPGIDGV